MKPKLTFAWFVVALALAAVLLVQVRQTRRQKIRMEKLQIEYEQLDQQEKTAKARLSQLEEETQRLRGELRATEVDLNNTRLAYNGLLQMTNNAGGHTGPASAPSGQAAGANMGQLFSNMMQDPEMRKAMEQQQRLGLDMIYGSLYKHLQLSPEREKEFREALLAMQMTNMAQAGAMFDPSNTNRTGLAEKLAADRKVAEDKIKDIIGEEKFAQFQDYNQTLPDRMMLDQFTKQSSVAPEQAEQLLAIIREEKQSLQATQGSENIDPARNWQEFMQSGEAAERLFAQQEVVNERVMERASQVLTPEQMEKFRPMLTNQISMQRAGLKMARQMLQNQPAPAPPSAPPQPVR